MNTPKDVAAGRARLRAARHILVVTHVAPDGDAIGSLCGLGNSLLRLGKGVTLACDDPVPETYRFIPSSNQAVRTLDGSPPADLLIAVDCADLARAGKVARSFGRVPDLCFDHHVTNPGFADINFVDADAAATAEVLFELLEPLGLPCDAVVAECLLAGLLADTQGFRTSSVSERTLTTAQGLMRAGANLPRTYDLALNRRSMAAAKLWGEGLVRLKLEEGIVWTTLTLAARAAAGYKGLGDADLINVLTTIYEADVSIVFIERPGGKVKISLRSGDGLDVAAVAQSFGGGGHAAAAGAEAQGTLEEVAAKVLEAVRGAKKLRVAN